MNIVFVGEDHHAAEFLKEELALHWPAINLEISPNTENALFRFVSCGACDAILLDASLPSSDAVDLIETIRNEKRPIGVVALVGATETELPIELYYAGVDRFILKRDGYADLLMEALQEAKERHPPESSAISRRARLFCVGDIGNAHDYLSRLPHITLEPLALSSDGRLQLPDASAFPGDVILIGGDLTGAQAPNAVRELKLRLPDIPVILLMNPGDENTAIAAMQMGAADCIFKTENYIKRLLPAVAREIGRMQLIREKALHRSKEERLRQIVEIMPAGITVIAPDGTFLAVNRRGLKLMGAARVEQIFGQNLVDLVPQEERERVLSFLTTVSGWASASICLDWKGPEGTAPGMELRAVPLRRESADTAAALAVINTYEPKLDNRTAIENNGCLDSQEYELLLQEFPEPKSPPQTP